MSIFTIEKLYKAYFDCRETKRKTINALEFEFDFENNLHNLLDELKNKKYYPGKSICFVVTEPTPREIFAANFRDRVVHHLLVNELLPISERKFIYDSYACRVGKGTHKAMKRLFAFVRKELKQTGECSYLQLDIRSFFMAIDKKILRDLVVKLITDEAKSALWKMEIMWLSEIIIDHDPSQNYRISGDRKFFKLIPGHKSLLNQVSSKGLPIGNYSSQFFANLYLNELDYFVKKQLKCRSYIRYVDDFVLLNRDRKILLSWRDEINDFLRGNLQIELNVNKTRLQSVAKGIDWLGYFIKPNHILNRQKVVKRFKNKANKFLSLCEKEDLDNYKNFEQTVNSYFAHFKIADTYNLRKNWCLKIENNCCKIINSRENYNKININLPEFWRCLEARQKS